jgi:hypothetical protein
VRTGILIATASLFVGCFGAHEIDGDEDESASSICEPACIGQPGSPVPFATTPRTDAPLHFAMTAGGCLRVTHDGAFLDAGGNDLNLSAGTFAWSEVPCAPALCDVTSQFNDEAPTDRMPSFRIHATADRRPDGSDSPAILTTVRFDACTGEILSATISLDPSRTLEPSPEDYTRAFGFALGLVSPASDEVESIVGADGGSGRVTPADAESLCAMYASGYCE